MQSENSANFASTAGQASPMKHLRIGTTASLSLDFVNYPGVKGTCNQVSLVYNRLK
jgi:hypothetical protein